MKTRKKEERGALGHTVASRNRFGEYIRERVIPYNVSTPARRRVWGIMAALSDLWNRITEEQRDGWYRLAEKVHSRPRLAQSGRLDGRLLFLKLNTVLATCGHPPLIDAPPPPQFGDNPVRGFAISEARRRLRIKLLVSEAPVEEIMVFASPPCAPGKRATTDYAFIGLLPAAEAGESDITELYLAKLKEWRKLKYWKYHIPLRGAKVFVRAVQHVNGWENQLWRFESRAFVPATVLLGGVR
jgi:hypothetical protein